jgi:hypothetical protein
MTAKCDIRLLLCDEVVTSRGRTRFVALIGIMVFYTSKERRKTLISY